MIVAFFAIVLTLLLVIGVHEAGHALVAHFFKIKIKRLSIGFGKPLVLWTDKNGCEWVLGRWFLGGYVQLNNTRTAPVSPKEYSTCFDKKPIWQRILVLLAGAFANIIAAWIAFSIVFYLGIHYKIPQIATVAPNSMAAKAGVMPEGQIISVDGKNTVSWQDVGQVLITSWGEKSIPITLKAPNGQVSQCILDLNRVKIDARTHSLLEGLGITPDNKAPYHLLKSPSLIDAIKEANKTIIHSLYFFIMILKQLVTGVIPFSLLLGPVGLFAASIASLTQGLMIFLYFIGTLSIAVALVNLLPIPGLDGGSIVYAFLEKIRGKPISIAWELLIYRLMMVVVFLVLVQLINNDIARFFVK